MIPKTAPPTASMGPGSFGTGKMVIRSILSSTHGFNGARFFWNREADISNVKQQGLGLFASMGPGSFGTGKMTSSSKVPLVLALVLQWGPVLLEPGRLRPAVRGAVVVLYGFNGARFFWNREGPEGPRRDAGAAKASMGPGSFGTGKRLRKDTMMRESASFNGARFFWNREAAPR